MQRLPDLLPPPAACVPACVRFVRECVCPVVFLRACEHVETKWQTTNRSSGKTGSLLDSGEPKKIRLLLLLPQPAAFSRGNFEKLFVVQLDTGGKVGGLYLLFCLSSGKKKERKKGALWIDSAFHTVLSGLAFNSRRTVFTN